MSADLILAVDAGTSATKVAAIDLTGRVVASAMEAYPSLHPRPGWVEQDVDVMFAAACDAMASVVAQVGADRMLALVCSAQRATWVPLGRDLVPLTHYIGWQDGRGNAVIPLLDDLLGDSYINRTGMKLDAVSSLSKIAWLVHERAEIAGSTRCFGGHQTLLLAQFGVDEALVSPSEASYMGLLDIATRDWAADVADCAGVDVSKLPRIVESGTRVGALNKRIADRVGLAAGLPLVMGGGDLQLGALGVGALQPGVVAVGIGTGGGSVAPSEDPHPDITGRLNCLAHVVPGMWEIEGLGSAAGGTFRWLKDTFGGAEAAHATTTTVDAYDLLVEQAAAEDPATGLIVIPSLAGLGSPYHDPEFSGAVLGLRLHHRRGQVIRAFMEGIALEQRTILETIRCVAGDVQSVRLWGGGAKSDLWCQMQVNMYAVPGVRCRVVDASLLGAAICGAVAVGAVDSFAQGVDQMVQVADSWEPEPVEVERCDVYYGVYQQAIEAMQGGTSHSLSNLRKNNPADDRLLATYTEQQQTTMR